MIVVGSLVKFTWWSSYAAPSAVKDDDGSTSWHEVVPGDTGVVLSIMSDDTFVVLFSRIDVLLKVSRMMLTLV